jgi:hypothetical protein
MDPWGHLAPWTFKDVIARDQGGLATAAQNVKTRDLVNQISGYTSHDRSHQSSHEGMLRTLLGSIDIWRII